MAERFFISGGQGFIGAWIARQLLAEGREVVLFDLQPEDHLIGQILEPDVLASVKRVYGDIADADVVHRAIDEAAPTAILHLAGLQVPTCRANPPLGARVNVLGTINVFESARRLSESASKPVPVVYASSAAVVGTPEDYDGPIVDNAHHEPRTHYGVFKTANEGNARVYWHDSGIPSVGLRPYTVYGVGREIGITSGPTKAIKAALLGRDFTIPFGGKTAFDFVEDIASYFIDCARAELKGAYAFNIRGHILSVDEFPAIVDEVIPGAAERIHVEGGPLPLAYDILDTGLRELLGDLRITPICEGVQKTVEHFRRLEEAGRLHDRDLEA